MKHIASLMPEALERAGVVCAVMHFDGACESKNPGGVATAGWYACDSQANELASGSHFVCSGDGATNNVAEYHALGFGLKWCCENVSVLKSLGCNSLLVRGDSQLVVNQVNGSWRCNKEHLRLLRDRCKQLIDQLEASDIAVVVQWVGREFNERADELSRIAYEEKTGKTFPVRSR